VGQLVSGGWTLEQSDALKGHIAVGLSYAKSAALINACFGTSFSRNAAIGRANRLGLQCQERPKAKKKPRVYKPRQRSERVRIIPANGNSNAMRVVSTVVVEQMRLRCVEIIPINLTLAQIDDTQCRYIAGDDHLYCGHPKMVGSSYCGPHHFLVWEKPKAPKPKHFARAVA
jgi:GcrA cell cycle regulator